MEVWDAYKDGAVLSFKLDSFELVVHVAASLEGLLLMSSYRQAKVCYSMFFSSNYFKNICVFSVHSLILMT